MTDQVRVHSDMPDRHLVMRRPWWTCDRAKPNPSEECMARIDDIGTGEPWMQYAACATTGNPEAWFPQPDGYTAENRMAVLTCRACPVRRECLDYALGEARAGRALFGVWAGTTYRQRLRMVQPYDHEANRGATA